jgi:hypothetical protein
MDMYRYSFFPILLLVLSLFSCNDNDAFLPVEQIQVSSSIPDELIVYFQEFESEAKERNVDIDLIQLGITAEFENIDENQVIGYCSTNSHNLRHISIDQTFWDRAGFYDREMLVFHELGHCALDRDHLDSIFLNGICKSIMNSGRVCPDAYNVENRSYYLDELFTG